MRAGQLKDLIFCPKIGGLINSNKDDFHLKLDSSVSYGYFSSNRMMEKLMILFFTKEVVIS
jgi:uncharacterized linocin/CFP29 family protein